MSVFDKIVLKIKGMTRDRESLDNDGGLLNQEHVTIPYIYFLPIMWSQYI